MSYGPETPVPIFQWREEFEQLLTIYRQRQPGRVLEVGTYHGGTLYHWLTAWTPQLVVTIDSYQADVDNRHLYEEWAQPGTRLKVIAGDSHDPEIVAAAAAAAPYDWLFIDAGHSYPEVRADWDNYRPLMAAGAIVAFHDILPPSDAWPQIEVERLWREIQRAGHLTRELVYDQNAPWGGIGVVFL